MEASLIGDGEFRLSDTAEARRLRTMLDAVAKAEGALVGLIEVTWLSRGFCLTICVPREGGEAAMAKAMAEEFRSFSLAQSLMVQAARDVMPAEVHDAWTARIEELRRSALAESQRHKAAHGADDSESQS